MTAVVGVVGHHKRLVQAWDMAHDVQASILSIDRGEWGPSLNHYLVWTQLAASAATAEWCVVLEDDAEPVKGFREQLDMVLAVAPSDIVGLYLGTGYPPAWQTFIEGVQREPVHWIQTHHLLHGVATAMRTELVQQMCEWISGYDNAIPVDDAITEWARAHAFTVSYTKPSIVDHKDGETLVEHPDGGGRLLPRRAWEFGSREFWNRSAVWIP